MNLTSSHPFWSVNNGLPAIYPSLQNEFSCDVVLIAAELIGDAFRGEMNPDAHVFRFGR